jgi:hypothetical protein
MRGAFPEFSRAELQTVTLGTVGPGSVAASSPTAKFAKKKKPKFTG